jgi:asparagine synthase (glutamine-hydrolysing)
MISSCGRYALSYNGEIYNFKEIRKELERYGRHFITNSDTEVLLEAWSEWGIATIEKLNGMFAFVIWDSLEETLYAVRDRYGVKPLYYFQHSDGVVFASEQRALKRHPLHVGTLNLDGVVEYLTFQNFFSNQTLDSSIRILEAGTFAAVSFSERTVKHRRYWDFNFADSHPRLNTKEYEEELARLMSSAVNSQMISDVEVGSYLSGGMDSGSLSSIASKLNQNLKTFTCGFDMSSTSGLEIASDERESAEQMSGVFGTEHYEMVLKAGDMQRCLPALVACLEEPRVGQSYPNFYAAKLASHFVKVVLSGTGGDEIFAGYPWRYFATDGLTSRESFVDGYFASWQRLLSQEELRNLCSPIHASVKNFDGRAIFDKVLAGQEWHGLTLRDQVNQCLYLESKTFLHGLLVIEDKISINFAMSCPVELKLDLTRKSTTVDENSPQRKSDTPIHQRSDGKRILRRAMRQYLPDATLGRPKQGFSGPDASWFRGPSIDFVRDRIYNKKSPLSAIMNTEVIQQLVEEHLSGSRNRRLLVWSFLCLDEILRSDSWISD